MKKVKLTVLFAFAFAMSNAQVVINTTDLVYPVLPSQANSSQASLTSVLVPTSGAGQTWDYSGLVATGSPFSYSYETPITDANFPTATAMDVYNTALGPFTVVGSRNYYRQDNDGFWDLGFRTDTNYFDISGSTGSPGDNVNLPVSYSLINNRKLMHFPLTSTSQWSNQVVGTTPFNLTVALYGINNTPGQLKQYINEQFEVIGSGTVQYPGSTSSHQGLLLKLTRERIDSVYLGGAPAPEILLNNFGIVQGAVTNNYYYEIFIPGLTRSAVYFEFTDSNFTTLNFISYCTDAPQLSSKSASAQSLLTVYPNPFQNEIFVPMNGNFANCELTVTDITGKIVFQSQNVPTNQKVSLSHLTNGLYLYQIKYSENLVAKGKLVKE